MGFALEELIDTHLLRNTSFQSFTYTFHCITTQFSDFRFNLLLQNDIYVQSRVIYLSKFARK